MARGIATVEEESGLLVTRAEAEAGAGVGRGGKAEVRAMKERDKEEAGIDGTEGEY